MMWKLIDDEPYIKPTEEMDKKLYCIFCGEKLVLRRVGNPRKRVSGGYAMDVNYKCPKCDWFVTFGVVIPTDKAEKINKKMKNSPYSPINIWRDIDKVKKRLESWGYW